MGLDMYIERVRRKHDDKQEFIEREELCYWRKFWELHNALGLYDADDYNNDIPLVKADVERAIDFAVHHEDYFGGFDSVPKLCELLRDFDEYKEDGWDIVYNANW